MEQKKKVSEVKDIEVGFHCFVSNVQILALNPKVQQFASLKSSAKTHKEKKHWKRNVSCSTVCYRHSWLKHFFYASKYVHCYLFENFCLL